MSQSISVIKDFMLYYKAVFWKKYNNSQSTIRDVNFYACLLSELVVSDLNFSCDPSKSHKGPLGMQWHYFRICWNRIFAGLLGKADELSQKLDIWVKSSQSGSSEEASEPKHNVEIYPIFLNLPSTSNRPYSENLMILFHKLFYCEWFTKHKQSN